MGKVIHPDPFPITPDLEGNKFFPCMEGYPLAECFMPFEANSKLADLMAIYWRIRRWKIDLTYTTNCEGEQSPLAKTNYLISTAEKEEDLVCGHKLILETDPSPSNSFDFNFCLDPCKDPSLKFYFLVGPREDCYTAEGATTTSACRSFDYPDPGEDITNTEIVLTIYKTAKIKFYLIQGGVFGAGLSVDAITPVLWWSYGGLYNTETGELN